MQPIVTFVQSHLVLILSFLLTGVVFYTLGLLTRRRHVIQILPAPVSPGLERAISAALASREIVYVQPAVSSVVEPVVKQASMPIPAAPVATAPVATTPIAAAPIAVAVAPIVVDQPAYSKPASGEKQALSKAEEIVHEIEALAAKIAHEVAAALDTAAKDALLAILSHMEHHSDDEAWFADVKSKIEHAHNNEELAACASEMLEHLQH